MIKVLVIIPYPELHEKAADALRENARPDIEYAITHHYGTNVDEMNVENADIILARGLTHKALKNKYPDVTVLELSVGAYDALHAIYECRKQFNARTIAIIGSISILHNIDVLQEILGTELHFFQTANEEEISNALDLAAKNNCDAIAGGLTACTMAQLRGFKCSLIRTSEESLHTSIKEAMNTAAVMQNERAKAEISRSILHNSKDAILYFDRNGTVTLHNPRAREVLNIPLSEQMSGKLVEDLFSDPEIIAAVRKNKEVQGILKAINRNLLVSNFSPVRVAEQAIGTICTFQRVNEIQEVETKIRRELSSKGLVAKYGFGDIIHARSSLSDTIATAVKYAGVDANVLLIGETGTGKELFAQSIHSSSKRREGPFVAVNCAAFSENLLESELFGYADGAFTGAVKGGKTGLFELAHGGTMFLDEIGEIPMALQATLLRALQEKEIRRIGDDKVIPVNVRVIAATNMDLKDRVAEGLFRMDLLYRLDVLSLWIPPLRNRREDISHIASHYMKQYCRKYDKPGLNLTKEAMEMLEAHDWPGNTRELRNICERLAVLGDNEGISANTVHKTLTMEKSWGGTAAKPAAAREQPPHGTDTIADLVNSMKMNKADIAAMLGISRTTLWRRINKQKSAGIET